MKKLIIIFHIIIMVFAYSSPFWLDYRLIMVGLLLYYLQILVFGGCILTFAQFGRWDETFTGRGIIFLGDKIGLKFTKGSVKRFLNILPALFIVIALLYQVILKIDVLVKIP